MLELKGFLATSRLRTPNQISLCFLGRSDGLGPADGWAGLPRPQCVGHSPGGR